MNYLRHGKGQQQVVDQERTKDMVLVRNGINKGLLPCLLRYEEFKIIESEKESFIINREKTKLKKKYGLRDEEKNFCENEANKIRAQLVGLFSLLMDVTRKEDLDTHQTSISKYFEDDKISERWKGQGELADIAKDANVEHLKTVDLICTKKMKFSDLVMPQVKKCKDPTKNMTSNLAMLYKQQDDLTEDLEKAYQEGFEATKNKNVKLGNLMDNSVDLFITWGNLDRTNRRDKETIEDVFYQYFLFCQYEWPHLPVNYNQQVRSLAPVHYSQFFQELLDKYDYKLTDNKKKLQCHFKSGDKYTVRL